MDLGGGGNRGGGLGGGLDDGRGDGRDDHDHGSSHQFHKPSLHFPPLAPSEAGFSLLYQQQARNVRAIARRMMKGASREDIEDICQDVFLSAFTRLAGFKGACSFRTWISRITVYTCLGRRRKFMQTRNGGCHLADMPGDVAVDDRSLNSLPDRLDRERLVERLLASLGPADRRILTLAYLEEQEAAEIAEALGTTESQVRSALHRAKERARDHGNKTP